MKSDVSHKLPQNECPHIIGLLHHMEYSELTTVDGLIHHIRERIAFNDMIRTFEEFSDLTHRLRPEYTMKDYGDHRRSTNLTRFECCPMCGIDIDWKAIRQIKL